MADKKEIVNTIISMLYVCGGDYHLPNPDFPSYEEGRAYYKYRIKPIEADIICAVIKERNLEHEVQERLSSMIENGGQREQKTI